MSEEQLKAAAAEDTEQLEEGVEEISEEDLAGVAGGSQVEVNPSTGAFTYTPIN